MMLESRINSAFVVAEKNITFYGVFKRGLSEPERRVPQRHKMLCFSREPAGPLQQRRPFLVRFLGE